MPIVALVRVTTPSDVQKVDVVATLSLDYKTSSGDWGQVEAFFRDTAGAGDFVALNPGSFPVVSPSSDLFTSTTLVWTKRAVPAAGRKYEFQIRINPRDGDSDAEVTVQGTKLSFVLETWKAGA
ncbi:MAG TPA: hypothetical protein VF660_07590 [Actinomycetota bacterium]